MSKVKGTAVAGRIDWVRQRHGEAAVAALIAALPTPAHRELIQDGRPLRSQWYPFELLVELGVAIDRAYGHGDLALVEEVGAWVAGQDVPTVYRIFFRVAEPLFVLDRASQLWRQYYDSGRMGLTERGAASCALELVGFETPHLAHCLGVTGWIRRTLELTGRTGVKAAHTACRARNERRCEWRASWQP